MAEVKMQVILRHCPMCGGQWAADTESRRHHDWKTGERCMGAPVLRTVTHPVEIDESPVPLSEGGATEQAASQTNGHAAEQLSIISSTSQANLSITDFNHHESSVKSQDSLGKVREYNLVRGGGHIGPDGQGTDTERVFDITKHTGFRLGFDASLTQGERGRAPDGEIGAIATGLVQCLLLPWVRPELWDTFLPGIIEATRACEEYKETVELLDTAAVCRLTGQQSARYQARRAAVLLAQSVAVNELALVHWAQKGAVSHGG